MTAITPQAHPGRNIAREPVRINQTVTGAKGNCFSACLAMMLGLPISEVPNFCESPGFDEDPGPVFRKAVNAWLNARGWGHITVEASGVVFHRNHSKGFVIAAGMTSRGLLHAVVYKDGELWHDPHPSHEGIQEVLEVDLLFPLNPAGVSEVPPPEPSPQVKALGNLIGDYGMASIHFAASQVSGSSSVSAENRLDRARAALLAEFSRLSELLECQHKIHLTMLSDFKDEMQLTACLREKVAALSAPSTPDSAKLTSLLFDLGKAAQLAQDDTGLMRMTLRAVAKLQKLLAATPPKDTPAQAPHPTDHAFFPDSVEGQSMCAICGWCEPEEKP